MHLTVPQLAKLMVLYKQQGLAAVGKPIVSSSFASDAMQSHWSTEWSSNAVCGGKPKLLGYGFRFYIFEPDFRCAVGLFGRFACYSPSHDLTLALIAEKDWNYAAGCTMLPPEAMCVRHTTVRPPPRGRSSRTR